MEINIDLTLRLAEHVPSLTGEVSVHGSLVCFTITPRSPQSSSGPMPVVRRCHLRRWRRTAPAGGVGAGVYPGAVGLRKVAGRAAPSVMWELHKTCGYRTVMEVKRNAGT